MPKTESIESIPNPGRTINGLRDTGYDFNTAVADLIDNSIAAGAETVSIRIEHDFRGEVQLSIADDGCGMDRDGLIQAMQYGSPERPDPASLGKYGLGLKTASTAFCRRLSLISRASGDDSAVMATWDLDVVMEMEQWLLQLSEQPDKEAAEHLDEVAVRCSGTVVLWKKVDRLLRDYKNPAGGPARKALSRLCTDLRHHIAMTYQRFLDPSDDRARNLDITVNGELVAPWDPFQIGLSELVAEEDVSIDGTDAHFTVRAYILPRRDEFPDEAKAKDARLSSDMQGFYIYREERLIHHTGWLGMFQKEPHSTLLRAEFSFNHKLDGAFHLDIKKSRITLNDIIWKWLRDQFLTAPRRESNRRYRQGTQRNIDQAASTAHKASNNSIRSKETEVGGAEVNIHNPTTGEVTVQNRYGQFSTKLKISTALRPGEVFVQPAEDVADGLLFEPAIIEQHRAVRINTRHPYYHKVYTPNLTRSVTIQGMDSLLWALSVAELSTTTDRTQEAFEDMRFEVTRILRKLVESLPDPEVD